MYVTQYKKQGASSILELSYNILPQQLRDCFLYLGVFPEDFEIPFQTLAYLWMAEGFIRDITSSEQSLEDVANEVLKDLIRSNLVTAGKLYYNGKVKTCRVHGVIHGFCKSKALEQNLFQEIKMSEEGDFDPPVSLTPNYRRLCIHSNLLEYFSRKPNGLGVRSFPCFQKESNDVVLETKHTSTIHKSFEFLKVFESKYFKFSEFPLNLTRLMNLHYISLCSDHLDALPETISDLLNLQTLIVETQSPELEIKGNIWRMIRLRHLITKAAITLPKQGEGKGGNELHTLTRLSPKYCEDVITMACNLRKLGIRGKVATLLTTDHLGKLDHLQSLKLENDESLDGLNRLHPLCFPLHLTSLTLSNTFLDGDNMLILGKLVYLKVLKLKKNAGRKDSWSVTDDGCFLNLEFLFIGSTDLVYWEVSPHCFPRLRCLVIKNCEKLVRIPLSLARSLEKLELENVSESAENSAREIKEDNVLMQRQEEGESAENSAREIKEENVRMQRQEEGGLHKLKLSVSRTRSLNDQVFSS